MQGSIWEIRHVDGFAVSNDPARLNFDIIHPALASSYWSPNIERAMVEKAARNSLPFGLYDPIGWQIGYCRVITDHTTFAYLADVWVAAERRGLGLGKFLVGSVVDRPEWRGLRRFLLFTADAHGLYAQYGFQALDRPERAMARPSQR